jgi:sterol desaturase/sphingolipid hydroxylase (fatty acid hydroxylase superfamily)
MNILINSTPLRLLIVIGSMVLLWSLEFGWPLAPKRKGSFLPNIVLTGISLALYGILGVSLVTLTDWCSTNGIGIFNMTDVSPWVTLVIGILFLDFWSTYLVHVLMHRMPIMWSFHQIHHLDTMVDVTTTFRHHPFETILRFFFMFTGTLLLGLPLWVVVTYQTLSSINGLLEHANIRLNDKLEFVLGFIFVTPGFHKLHHSSSQPETDSNYANLFTIWDRAFGTLNTKRLNQVIKYGLDGTSHTNDSTVNLLAKPLKPADVK